ncbi:MAG: hypothetical protein ABIC57_01620 [bacterium]
MDTINPVEEPKIQKLFKDLLSSSPNWSTCLDGKICIHEFDKIKFPFLKQRINIISENLLAFEYFADFQEFKIWYIRNEEGYFTRSYLISKYKGEEIRYPGTEDLCFSLEMEGYYSQNGNERSYIKYDFVFPGKIEQEKLCEAIDTDSPTFLINKE